MKAKFIGVPGESLESLFMYGQDYPKGKSVTVNTEFARRKMAKHPHFEITSEKSDDAEDAEIKKEFDVVADAALKREQERIEAEERAQVLQAKVNADLDAAEEASRGVGITSAVEFQKAMDTPPTLAPMPSVVKSAIEFQNLQEAVTYGNGNGLGDSGTEEESESGSRGNRKRGRPAASK